MTAGVVGARAVARAVGSAISALAHALGLVSRAPRIRATFVVPPRPLTFVAPARPGAFIIPARPLLFVVTPGLGARGATAGEGEGMRATFQTVDGTSFLNPLDHNVPFAGDLSAILPSGTGATVSVYAATGIPQDGSASFNASAIVQGTPTLGANGALAINLGGGAANPQLPRVTYRLRLQVSAGGTDQEVTVDLPCIED